jgi:predicted nucleotidyltransferase
VKKRDLVAKHRQEILALAARHGLSEVGIFGSVARGQDGEGSDIDFLVKRQGGSDPFELIEFKEALEELLGCRVDLLTDHRWMRPRLKNNIERDLVPL